MSDLSTTYLGLTLRSPLVASAGPHTGNPAMWQRLEDAGAGAIVLPSLFEEEIEHDAFTREQAYDDVADRFGEASSFLPALDLPDVGPNRYLTLVEQARERMTIPVIASLNGTSPGGWVRYAKHIAEAGAHAIELNLYDSIVDPGITAADAERRYAELVEDKAIGDAIYGRIEAEYQRTEDYVCKITGQKRLLDNVPVLQRSIDRRNPYVDPMSYVQLVLLERLRRGDEPHKELLTATLESINGIASGLKNTG